MQIIRRPAKPKISVEYEPEEFDKKPLKGKVAIFDTETDPFAVNRIVKPFSCGFYIPDDGTYVDFWGDDCISQFFDYLASEFPGERFSIFVHNGGNFDFYFLVNHFDEGMKPFIINGRLVRIEAQGHEFRDSYAMIPVALGNALKADDGGKIEIDYAKLERDVREKHKDEILAYQKQDCVALGKLVTAWLDMFGNRLTMASVALPMLRSYHGFDNMTEAADNEFRPYYFGGRCQPFETGVLVGRFKGFDINSSYPDVMRRIKHPISSIPGYEKKITARTHFAHIRAWSNGALPIRKPDGGLSFPVGIRDFFACIHEINAGLETGTLRIHHVFGTIYFESETCFDTFIDTFYALRLKAGDDGDEINKLFYKLVMNSSYGKFAQDPRKYENWIFDPPSIPTPLRCDPCYERFTKGEPPEECARCAAKTHDSHGWYLHTERDGYCIYASPQKLRNGGSFFNVATAASITSAARASLLYGINAAKRPIYVDTDSILCEALGATERVIHDKKQLGAWKAEFECELVAIAGKKMYVCASVSETYAREKSDGKDPEKVVTETGAIYWCVKKASKGVRLTAQEIYDIARGAIVEYANPVPKFSLFRVPNARSVLDAGDGVSAQFITRRISATGGEVREDESFRA